MIESRRFASDDWSWQLQTFGLAETAPTADDLAIRLADLRIAIYTLTESSSRQAKTAIEQTVTSVKVDCNADHGGTARLRALAENADLFVMTSLSAKHAATDFIREHRGDRPLLYAQGRGFSSILRAIEDHLSARHYQVQVQTITCGRLHLAEKGRWRSNAPA